MAKGHASGHTRDRLLLAAAELMHASGDTSISTRAVCERAGVEAPTLYHHFGSKQGLIDAVLQHGFNQYVDPQPAHDTSLDAIEAIRQGWDRHVRFGLDNPRFYALLYGNVERGRPCAITSPALTRLRELLNEAARAGRLRVAPAEAAPRILAANVGVALSLIAQPEDATDLSLSDHVREAVLTSILADSAVLDEAPPGDIRAAAALALNATLDSVDVLTSGERALLRELLDRLADPTVAGPPSASRERIRSN
jgi:AcrR family transcriptional regulator